MTGRPFTRPTSTDAWVVTLAEAGVLAGITAAALGGLLLAAQRYERWRRRPGDPEGSRVALLARRPSLLRIRAALGTAGAVAHETAVPSVAVLSLQTRLEAIQSVPGRVVVGRRAGDDGDAIVDIDELHRVELVGPGAEGAARALIVSFLAHHGTENGQVVVATSPDGALIAAAEGTPGLRLLEPAQLLDHLESEIRYQRGVLDRAGFTTWKERLDSPDPLPALLAVLPAAAIEPSHLERLTAAVEAARDLAVAVVIVGPLADAWWADVVEVDPAGSGGALSSLLLGRARTLHTLSRSEARRAAGGHRGGPEPRARPRARAGRAGLQREPVAGPVAHPRARRGLCCSRCRRRGSAAAARRARFRSWSSPRPWSLAVSTSASTGRSGCWWTVRSWSRLFPTRGARCWPCSPSVAS